MRWCPGTESNCRHADFQSAALPTELPGHRGAARWRDRLLRGWLPPCPAPRPQSSSGSFSKGFPGLVGSAGAPGMAYPPFSHWPRSRSAQRLEQKGLNRSAAGLPQMGQSAISRPRQKPHRQRQGQAHHIGIAARDFLHKGFGPALNGIAARLAHAFPAFQILRDMILGQPQE